MERRDVNFLFVSLKFIVYLISKIEIIYLKIILKIILIGYFCLCYFRLKLYV